MQSPNILRGRHVIAAIPRNSDASRLEDKMTVSAAAEPGQFV